MSVTRFNALISAALAVAIGLLATEDASAADQPGFSWGEQPIVALQAASQESLHVEYPTVFALGEARAMLYSAFGEDRRWRIKMALAQDGQHFVKQGNVFDERALPFSGNYAFPFVVAGDGEHPGFELYFSAADEAFAGYTGLYRSTSTDGLAWTVPVRVLAVTGFDPVVVSRSSGHTLLYTSVHEGRNVLEAVDLKRGAIASARRIVYRPEEGIYTLGLVHFQGKPIIVLEVIDAWAALCFSDTGQLVNVGSAPILKSVPAASSNWDRLKYGMHFFEADAKVFYNGITGRGAEQGGQIGVASYDADALFGHMDVTGCQ